MCYNIEAVSTCKFIFSRSLPIRILTVGCIFNRIVAAGEQDKEIELLSWSSAN